MAQRKVNGLLKIMVGGEFTKLVKLVENNGSGPSVRIRRSGFNTGLVTVERLKEILSKQYPGEDVKLKPLSYTGEGYQY